MGRGRCWSPSQPWGAAPEGRDRTPRSILPRRVGQTSHGRRPPAPGGGPAGESPRVGSSVSGPSGKPGVMRPPSWRLHLFAHACAQARKTFPCALAAPTLGHATCTRVGSPETPHAWGCAERGAPRTSPQPCRAHHGGRTLVCPFVGKAPGALPPPPAAEPRGAAPAPVPTPGAQWRGRGPAPPGAGRRKA